jgi:aryl-alcohol dehydrogenase-like predicted oxidoreductase
MRRIRFGKTGVEVSAISIGTWSYGGAKGAGKRSYGWSGHDDQVALAALRAAFDHGLTHWDTADVYGDGKAESLIGSLWESIPREQIFLASKVGWKAGDFKHFYHPKLMRQQIENSLRYLKTDCLDLYYFHHCDFGPSDEYLDDAVAQMRRFFEEGKARFLGLSDWNAARILKFADYIKPDVVQPCRNIIDDDYASSGLKTWIEDNDIGVAFFSPLRHGLLLGKHTQPPLFGDGDHRQQISAFQDQNLLDHLLSCRKLVEAKFSHLSEPLLTALLGSLLSDAPSGCVLLGMRSPSHVKAAYAAGEEVSLADAAWVRDLYNSGGWKTIPG